MSNKNRGNPNVKEGLRCKRCGKEYRGYITSSHCYECRDELKAEEEQAKKTEEQKGITEAPVVAREGNATEETPSPYKKKVEVDKNRTRYDPERKNPVDIEKANAKAAKKQRETKEEKEFKEPLRQELVELTAQEAELVEKLSGIKARKEEIQLLLVPAVDSKVQKSCFGRYDPKDFECTSLCPLMTECEVTKTGKVTPPVDTPEFTEKS